MFSYLKHRLYFTRYNLGEAVLMSIHNLCFGAKKKEKKRSILLAVINIYRTCVFLTFQYFIKKTHLKYIL